MLGKSILRLNSNDFSIVAPSSDEVNLFNLRQLKESLADSNPNLVIHTAAKVGGIQANINNPIEFLYQNLKIDANLFQVSSELRIKNLIYIGSSCMYPKDMDRPYLETDINNGKLEETNESYALAKIVGYHAVKTYSRKNNLNWKVLVLSNLYGPNDHFSKERSHLIAAIIRKVSDAVEKKEKSISMWGDGTARREFTFVDDVANFILKNFNKIEIWPEIMNLGSGEDFSVAEYYKMVANILDFKGMIERDDTKPSGMKMKLMNSGLSRDFGWKPETSIEVGLRNTVKWYLSNKENLND